MRLGPCASRYPQTVNLITVAALSASQSFIAGWCRLAWDFRLFRTDRIVKVE
jgi:predicted DNA-binding transcriptional regulator YafY